MTWLKRIMWMQSLIYMGKCKTLWDLRLRCREWLTDGININYVLGRKIEDELGLTCQLGKCSFYNKEYIYIYIYIYIWIWSSWTYRKIVSWIEICCAERLSFSLSTVCHEFFSPSEGGCYLCMYSDVQVNKN